MEVVRYSLCPKCGQKVGFKENTKTIICDNCHEKLVVDNKEDSIILRSIPDYQQSKKNEKENNKKLLIVGLLILIIIVIVLILLLK